MHNQHRWNPQREGLAGFPCKNPHIFALLRPRNAENMPKNVEKVRKYVEKMLRNRAFSMD
ncbi:MAG TPA: hypothetical protein VMI72_09020 [Roseiarcus sp.]|nr:hypothetical protein [Roseiarcus sp.]